VFTGAVLTRSSLGGAPNDGTLTTLKRAAAGNIVNATYNDTNPENITRPTNCRTFGRRHACSVSYIAAQSEAEITLSNVGTFAIGNNVTITVTDGDRNLNLAEADSLTVLVSTVSTVFNLTLNETGPDTGIFTGVVPTRGSGSATPPAVVVAKGTLLTFNYSEASPARVQSRSVTGNFLGDLSQTFNVLLTGGTLRITLVDSDLNTIPSELEQVSGILVTSGSTGQREVVTLTERDSTSGAFVGVLPTRTDMSRGEDFSGTMYVTPGTMLTIAYSDVAPQQRITRMVRLATVGVLTRSPVAAFVGGQLRITVTDPDVDRDPFAAEQLTGNAVRLSIRDTPTDESLTLTETGFSTGVFTGAITLTSGSNDPANGLLGPVTQGGYVFVKYRDEFPLDLFELSLPVYQRGTITVTPSPSFDITSDTLRITVVDNDLNRDPLTVETMGKDGLVTVVTTSNDYDKVLKHVLNICVSMHVCVCLCMHVCVCVCVYVCCVCICIKLGVASNA
jgi:hypothetical protein